MRARPARGALAWIVAAWGACLPTPAAAIEPRGEEEITEPPPDVPEGTDHVEAADDSLPGESLELGLGLVGTGRTVERRRRVSFSGRDLSGTVREGSGDPLAGGSVVERGAWGELRAGKLGPRWNRGLLLGSPGDPWQSAALEVAARPGRSGEGAELRLTRGAEVLVGRFGGTPLVGAALARGRFTLGLLGASRRAQTTLGFASDREALEVAAGPGGLWRAETIWRRGAEGSGQVIAAVRQGSAGFRSLAEPRRAGPARSITVRVLGPRRGTAAEGLVSVWRFRSGHAGARAAFQLERTLAAGSVLAAGFEQQQGDRGELRSPVPLREGGWLEWSTPARPLGLLVRHETWGARACLRDVTRAVSSFRLEARLPRGASLSAAHLVYRVRRGESLYLRESESDRMVLRALAGEGQRTRLDLRIPLAHGALRAGGQLTAPLGGTPSPRWTIDWTRRARAGGSFAEPRPPPAGDP